MEDTSLVVDRNASLDAMVSDIRKAKYWIDYAIEEKIQAPDDLRALFYTVQRHVRNALAKLPDSEEKGDRHE